MCWFIAVSSLPPSLRRQNYSLLVIVVKSDVILKAYPKQIPDMKNANNATTNQTIRLPFPQTDTGNTNNTNRATKTNTLRITSFLMTLP